MVLKAVAPPPKAWVLVGAHRGNLERPSGRIQFIQLIFLFAQNTRHLNLGSKQKDKRAVQASLK